MLIVAFYFIIVFIHVRLELGSAVFEVQDFTDPLDISGVPDKIDVQVKNEG